MKVLCVNLSNFGFIFPSETGQKQKQEILRLQTHFTYCVFHVDAKCGMLFLQKGTPIIITLHSPAVEFHLWSDQSEKKSLSARSVRGIIRLSSGRSDRIMRKARLGETLRMLLAWNSRGDQSRESNSGGSNERFPSHSYILVRGLHRLLLYRYFLDHLP